MTRTPAAVPPFPERMEGEGANASPGCYLRVLPDGRPYEIDMNDAGEYSDDICAEGARMAWEAGGGTHPVSSYYLDIARVKITGEVREVAMLRAENAALRAEIARLSITREPQEG